MISFWESNGCTYNDQCIPTYEVNPVGIDDDPVMNKILDRPIIGIDILVNIYNTMKRKNTLVGLNGTRLGKFFETNPYFVAKGGMNLG